MSFEPGGGDLHEVVFRAASAADADALLDVKRQLDVETRFTLLEPDERTETAEQVAAELRRQPATGNSIVIVAVAGGRLVGYVEATGGAYRRNRATAYVVLGVVASSAGRGIGGGLLDELDRWAGAHAIHRLELTVMAGNARAVRLYEAKGYVREGVRRECLAVDGVLVDELYMGKLL